MRRLTEWNFSRVCSDSDDDKLTVSAQRGHETCDGFATRCRCKDDTSTTHVLQSLYGVNFGTVNVVMGPKLEGYIAFGSGRRERDDAVAHLGCELNAEMTKATDPLNGDDVPWSGVGVADGVYKCM